MYVLPQELFMYFKKWIYDLLVFYFESITPLLFSRTMSTWFGAFHHEKMCANIFFLEPINNWNIVIKQCAYGIKLSYKKIIFGMGALNIKLTLPSFTEKCVLLASTVNITSKMWNLVRFCFSLRKYHKPPWISGRQTNITSKLAWMIVFMVWNEVNITK